jgi:putative thioredoxin
VINEAEGLLLLAKINIDENQQIAAQLRIQSIPAVIAFYKKQIVNGFQGVLPKQKIIDFIEKIYGSPLPKNKDEIYKSIYNLIEQNQLEQAQNLIEDSLAENSNDAKIISLYIKCLCELKKLEDVKKFLSSLSDKLLKDQIVQKEIKNYKMLESASKDPSIEVLLSKYNMKPNDIDNVIKLSEKYFYEKQIENALELLFTNFSKFNNKDKEKIKNKLLKLFDSLGNNHEQTKIYRRKLSSLLFS